MDFDMGPNWTYALVTTALGGCLTLVVVKFLDFIVEMTKMRRKR